MKDSIKIMTGAIALLFTLAGSCPGQEGIAEKRSTGTLVETYKPANQEQVRLNRTTTLSFSKEDEPSIVHINQTGEYNFLAINIACDLTEGGMIIELLDPKGEKQGTYTVKGGNDSIETGDKTISTEKVTGQLQKAFRHPVKGKWTVRAIPLSATANLVINIIQEFNSRIDYLEMGVYETTPKK